jgi:hypothetical protein
LSTFQRKILKEVRDRARSPNVLNRKMKVVERRSCSRINGRSSPRPTSSRSGEPMAKRLARPPNTTTGSAEAYGQSEVAWHEDDFHTPRNTTSRSVESLYPLDEAGD